MEGQRFEFNPVNSRMRRSSSSSMNNNLNCKNELEVYISNLFKKKQNHQDCSDTLVLAQKQQPIKQTRKRCSASSHDLLRYSKDSKKAFVVPLEHPSALIFTNRSGNVSQLNSALNFKPQEIRQIDSEQQCLINQEQCYSLQYDQHQQQQLLHLRIQVNQQERIKGQEMSTKPFQNNQPHLMPSKSTTSISKLTTAFKAKPMPNFQLPFTVYKSNKPLTQPEEFPLKTKERSISHQQSHPQLQNMHSKQSNIQQQKHQQLQKQNLQALNNMHQNINQYSSENQDSISQKENINLNRNQINQQQLYSIESHRYDIKLPIQQKELSKQSASYSKMDVSTGNIVSPTSKALPIPVQIPNQNRSLIRPKYIIEDSNLKGKEITQGKLSRVTSNGYNSFFKPSQRFKQNESDSACSISNISCAGGSEETSWVLKFLRQ